MAAAERVCQARDAGILDALVDGDLRAGAIEFARSIAGKKPPKTSERTDRLGDAAANEAAIAARSTLAKISSGR